MREKKKKHFQTLKTGINMQVDKQLKNRNN